MRGAARANTHEPGPLAAARRTAFWTGLARSNVNGSPTNGYFTTNEPIVLQYTAVSPTV